MTNQIVIKLNKDKFKPLIEKLHCVGYEQSLSYSNAVGKSLFFCYLVNSEKIPSLENMTIIDYVCKNIKKSREELLLSFLAKYVKWLKEQNLYEKIR